jgi:hypothetical protein
LRHIFGVYGSQSLLRTIGSFLVVIAALLLIQSGARMFDSWQVLKEFNGCVENSGIITSYSADVTDSGRVFSQLRYEDCKNSLYEITGAQVKGGEIEIRPFSRTFFTSLINPVANFFIWAMLLLLGISMYRNNALVFHSEQVDHIRPFAKKRK